MTEAEISQFCSVFPRHSFSVSHNLLSEPTRYAKSMLDCANADLAAAPMVEEIARSVPAGSPRSASISTLRQHIASRVASINRAIAEGSLDLTPP
ncbi:MAG: hypothetical protein EOP84_34465 [Verrucomicrobiaceae bacterium]|nr:MAG: hypothetical protein EOP84_34465 [Verrucomicrobiaceae bacterium]